MSATVRVVRAYRLRHHESAESISPFSALPYGSPEEWERIWTGYTWECVANDGTVTQGLCRAPEMFRDAAEAIAARYAEQTGATHLEGEQ